MSLAQFAVTTWCQPLTCCHKDCGVLFAMTSGLYEDFKQDAKRYFFCPNGHQQHFAETEETRLRRELEQERKARAIEKERLLSDAATHKRIADSERKAREHVSNQLRGVKAHRDKIVKRIDAGVCPCCNRTFGNLAAHMKTKHPKVAILKRRKKAA